MEVFPTEYLLRIITKEINKDMPFNCTTSQGQGSIPTDTKMTLCGSTSVKVLLVTRA